MSFLVMVHTDKNTGKTESKKTRDASDCDDHSGSQLNKLLRRMALSADRNFAQQSTYFCSDTAVADVNTEVQSCFKQGDALLKLHLR